MKIKGELTSVKVLPWGQFATFNVAVLIHSFVHIGYAFGTTIYFFIRSVHAFGTTHSIIVISFTKPSMTTVSSSSSKVKPCFLIE
jgi:hypothetical protein